jgi:hypothetical protein
MHTAQKGAIIIMANKKNLKPLQDRTTSEQREIAQKGGIRSGESRRTRRTLRDMMECLLSAPLTEEETAEYTALGLDPEDLDRRAALVVGLYKRACEGDTKAYSLIADMIGEKTQTAREKEGDVKTAGEMLDLVESLTIGR